MAAGFLARQSSPKGARVTRFLVFFVLSASPKKATTVLQTGLGRRPEDRQSRPLTGTEILGSSSLS